MGYSHKVAKDEREQEVAQALQTRDSEALYHLAKMFKEEGDDEQAELLLGVAKKIDREDFSYDEWVDNKLQDELN